MECSLFIRPNLCCRETLGPIQHRLKPFKHHPSVSRIPLSFEKGSRVFKMWTGSWAIQGVSNASRSARLLNAKQTVEQIKIKGSSLARCPHMPGAAVTVNHGSAASMLIVANIPLPPAKGRPPLFTVWELLWGSASCWPCVCWSRPRGAHRVVSSARGSYGGASRCLLKPKCM